MAKNKDSKSEQSQTQEQDSTPEKENDTQPNLSNIQLQNLLNQEREDKDYYKNLVNSAIEYLDAEQTQINDNRQVFKKAFAVPPSIRTKVNVPVEVPKEDNKNKKKSK